MILCTRFNADIGFICQPLRPAHTLPVQFTCPWPKEGNPGTMLAVLLLLVAFDQGALAQVTSSGRFVWTQILPAAGSPVPGPRSNAALGFFPASQRLVMFGGSLPGGSSDDTWIYDLRSNVWTQVPTNPTPTRRHTAAVGAWTADGKEELIIAHGTQRGSQVLDDIWSFSLATRTWRPLPNVGDVPKKRYAPASGIYPGSSLFFMGFGFAKFRYSDTFVYDLNAERWTIIHKGTNPYNPKLPHARCLLAGALPQENRFTIYGGCLQIGFTGGPCPARDSWTMSFSLAAPTPGGSTPLPRGADWSRMDDGPSPRAYPGLARVPPTWNLGQAPGQGLVMLYGGDEKGRQTITVEKEADADLDILNTATGKWLQGTAYPPTAGAAVPGFRTGPSLATDDAGARIFMFGGALRSSNSDTNELWVLTYEPSTSAAAGQRLGAWNRERPQKWFLFIHLHGLFMGLSWGLLLPAGVLMARHLRHKDPLWFRLHRCCQVTGVTLSLLGLIVVVAGGAFNPIFAHGIIGLLVVGAGLYQPLNAYFRPHKGQPKRRKWEFIHKGTGRFAVIFGLINVSLGTFLIVGPASLYISWHVLLGIIVLLALVLEVILIRKRKAAARAAGTYQHGFKGLWALYWQPEQPPAADAHGHGPSSSVPEAADDSNMEVKLMPK